MPELMPSSMDQVKHGEKERIQHQKFDEQGWLPMGKRIQEPSLQRQTVLCVKSGCRATFLKTLYKGLWRTLMMCPYGQIIEDIREAMS